MPLKVVQTIDLPEEISGQRIMEAVEKVVKRKCHIEELVLVIDETEWYSIGQAESFDSLTALVFTGENYDEPFCPTASYKKIAVVCEGETCPFPLSVTKQDIVQAAKDFRDKLEAALLKEAVMNLELEK